MQFAVKKSAFGIAFIAALALVAWFVMRGENSQPAASGVESGARPVRNETPQRESPGAAQTADGAAHPAASAAALADIRKKFYDFKDYFAFAASIYDAARQGDGAAQFYLYQALNYCGSLYIAVYGIHLPGGGVRYRTLDEALQVSWRHPFFTDDDVRDMQTRCERIATTKPAPYGTAQEWLDAAIASGYPLAQVMMANNKALEAAQNPASDAAADARHLLIDALRTKDPEVIVQTGDAAANLSNGGWLANSKKVWIWAMAACGSDEKCPQLDQSIQYLCRIDPQCQPFETPVDIIRRRTGNDFDEIESAARALREKIDAGTIEESDI